MALSILVLSNGGTANAETLKSDQSNLVTVEEYQDTISKIYASYGIEWEIIDSSNAIPITKELFDSQIEKAHKEGEEYQTELNRNKLLYSDTNSNTNKISNKEDIGILSVMPVRTFVYATTSVENWPLYMAELQAIADITYNADTGAMMYLHSWYIITSSGFNYESWVDAGSSVSISGTSCTAQFRGTCYFSYSEPNTGFKVTKGVFVWTNVPMH